MYEIKTIDRRFEVLAEVYRLYHGFYQNVVVTISGRLGHNAATTSLFVKAFDSQGRVINSITQPFHSMRTARAAAREFCDGMVRFGKTGRAQGWAERDDYKSHMTVYRNYHADRGLPFYDRGELRNDRPVSQDERQYHARRFDLAA